MAACYIFAAIAGIREKKLEIDAYLSRGDVHGFAGERVRTEGELDREEYVWFPAHRLADDIGGRLC